VWVARRLANGVCVVKVILDEAVKKDLTSVTNKFFSSKQVYEDLGVPWKRGLLFHGPPGNGKTISIKA